MFAATIGAATRVRRGQVRQGGAQQLRRVLDEFQQSWIRHSVVDEASFAARQEDPPFPQRHQVLGKICLPPAKCGLKVADAGLALANGKQDLQPCRPVDALHQVGHFLNRGYIQHYEYIVSAPLVPAKCGASSDDGDRYHLVRPEGMGNSLARRKLNAIYRHTRRRPGAAAAPQRNILEAGLLHQVQIFLLRQRTGNAFRPPRG